MERENVSDRAAEMLCQYPISPNFFEGSEKPKKEINHCIVFCKKVTPNVFDISKGVAVVGGAESLFNDGNCMIAPAAKVVFVFE